MKELLAYLLLLGFTQFTLIECLRRECVKKQIPKSDTVCVCNATYCDNFPAIHKPETGFALVYESNKAGLRFKETVLKIEKSHKASTTTKSQTVTIDSTQKYQRIYGFGGAFTDATGVMLKQVSESLANSIIDSYFSADGIEYSMARIPIAGTDYSPRAYSYDDVEGDLNLTHFALQKEDLEFKIPYIHMAQKLSPHKIKFFASPWSPPAWMKTNNQFNGTGYLRGEVSGDYYKTFAHYFVKFLDSYKSQGIDMWGITVENEPSPDVNPKHAFNSLTLTPSQERDFVKMNLGPTLDKAGYGRDKLKLMIIDISVGPLVKSAETILGDKEAAKYVSGIAYHWYENQMMKPFPKDIYELVHAKYPDIFMLNTEASHGTASVEGFGNGRWDFGEHYAHDIIKSWVEWNMAVNMTCGPRWMDKHGYSGPVFIDPKAGEAYKQPTFYAIGHFSKFIPPNSVRIGYKVDKEVDGLFVLTVLRPDNATVVVALNANNEEIEFNIKDSESYLSNKLSPHSMQSFIWW